MITRDSAASISGTAQNARQRFGEVLKFHREQRQLTTRRVADMCGVSREAVENWEAGHVVPDGKSWDKLKGMVNRRLPAYSELRGRALAEAEAARTRVVENRDREHKEQSKMGSKINTSLADKLGNLDTSDRRTSAPALKVVPQEPAVHQTRKPRKPSPPGSFGAVQIARRTEFVRNMLRQRPNANTSGRDSVLEAVRNTFGVGISQEAIELIRAEVAAECRSPNTHTPITGVHRADEVTTAQRVEATINGKPATVTERSPGHYTATPAPASAGDIETAVQLVLEALPNLQTFTITVDEHGEASVDYQIRKVVVTTDGGSFKVKR